MAVTFLLSTQNVKDNTVLDDNIGDNDLKNILYDAQDVELQQLLGTDLYDTILYNAKNYALTAKQTVLVDKYITRFLYAAVEYLSVDALLIKYDNIGVYEQSPDNSLQVDKDRLLRQIALKEGKMEYRAGLLKEYLKDNLNDFPEYNTNESGIPSVKIRTAGFFLDDDDYTRDYYYNRTRGDNDFEQSI